MEYEVETTRERNQGRKQEKNEEHTVSGIV